MKTNPSMEAIEGSRRTKTYPHVIELANKSTQYTKGIAENVIVQIDKFAFLVDLVILDIEEDSKSDNEIKSINLCDEEIERMVGAEVEILHSWEDRTTLELVYDLDYLQPNTDKKPTLFTTSTTTEDKQIPKVKEVPSYLEYAFLDGRPKFPIIISSILSKQEKTLLLQVLTKHKIALAWKVADIKAISPSFCTHKFLWKIIIILLFNHNEELIPKCKTTKEGGMTVINEKNDLVPTRTVPGWRVCIDYRKLNAAIRKDHFLLPFIDQMLERYMTAIFHDMCKDFMEVFMMTFLFLDVKPRLIRWVLLLQEFTVEIKYKKKAENLAANHLSILENPDIKELDEEKIRDSFPEEHLIIRKPEKDPWYADYANFLVSKVMPRDMTYHLRKKFFLDLKYYIWDETHVGGHYEADITARKVFEAGFYWPTILKDAARFLQLHQLAELRNEAYEHSRAYKERKKRWYDTRIQDKEFREGQEVLLFNSKLKLFLVKLKTRWYGPYMMSRVFPYGTVEVIGKKKICFKAL
nr:hypothetical protein [Tanacetum cinerariifolium]